jgi:hypothetical protein
VPQVAYAKALEKIAGVEVAKVLNIPASPTTSSRRLGLRGPGPRDAALLGSRRREECQLRS